MGIMDSQIGYFLSRKIPTVSGKLVETLRGWLHLVTGELVIFLCDDGIKDSDVNIRYSYLCLIRIIKSFKFFSLFCSIPFVFFYCFKN